MNARRFEELLLRVRDDIALLLEPDPQSTFLKPAYEDVLYLLESIEVGTKARPRTVARWALALERLHDWMVGASGTWAQRTSGGDTSDPTGRAAFARIDRDGASASSAEAQLGDLIDNLKALALELNKWRFPEAGPEGENAEDERNRLRRLARGHRVVVRESTASMQRIVEIATVTKISRKPDEKTELPGCASCARPQRGNDPESGHFAEVFEKAKKHQLCRWCWGHAIDDGHRQGLPKGEIGEPPSLDLVDIYHRLGPRLAGIEIAKRVRAVA